MGKNWYILHIYSGLENKVVKSIESSSVMKEFPAAISNIKVPVENLVEMKDGKKYQTKSKIFPGYILIEMDLPDTPNDWKKICGEITKIHGVTGFLGATKNEKPRPLPMEDVKEILQKMGEIRTSDHLVPKVSFDFGETVKVVDGPFRNFNGIIEDINLEKGKLKVKVEIFGRSTPIELDFLQVEKL